MSGSAIVRPVEKQDVRAVAELIGEIEQFYGSTEIQPFDERQVQVEEALFGAPPIAQALVVENGAGELVGFAAYSFLWPGAGSAHSLFLKELYVRSSLRRQGIGKRLMEELRSIASARAGCTRVEWMADRDNPGAPAFYDALGFTELGGKIVYRVDTGAA